MLEEQHREQAREMDADSTAVSGPMRKTKLNVKVSSIRDEAEAIRSYELVDASGEPLPDFTAGAHVEVNLAPDMIRSYSLCSDPSDTSHYRIAVLKEFDGRGGSKKMHDDVNVGDVLTISAPINHFPLAGREARAHLLLAGGIGVTPMIAMIAELERKGARWSMHYLTRSEERTAFREQLAPMIADGKVQLHHDGGDPTKGPSIQALVSDFEIGTHLYYCGPAGFMSACESALEAWPPHAVHREYFSAPDRELDERENVPFEITIKSTGKTVTVPADRSIVEVLRGEGCAVETDCNEGYCGTCITRYLSGEPVHRDTVLSDKERKSYIMVCCGRSNGGVLELDV